MNNDLPLGKDVQNSLLKFEIKKKEVKQDIHQSKSCKSNQKKKINLFWILFIHSKKLPYLYNFNCGEKTSHKKGEGRFWT